MLRHLSSFALGVSLLAAVACSKKQNPAPSLDGRWNTTQDEVTRYDYGQAVQTYQNTGMYENYISFSGSTCEISEPGMGKSQYTYTRQDDTLRLTPMQSGWLPIKSVILQHTKTTLQLRTTTQLSGSVKLVSRRTYER